MCILHLLHEAKESEDPLHIPFSGDHNWEIQMQKNGVTIKRVTIFKQFLWIPNSVQWEKLRSIEIKCAFLLQF